MSNMNRIMRTRRFFRLLLIYCFLFYLYMCFVTVAPSNRSFDSELIAGWTFFILTIMSLCLYLFVRLISRGGVTFWQNFVSNRRGLSMRNMRQIIRSRRFSRRLCIYSFLSLLSLSCVDSYLSDHVGDVLGFISLMMTIIALFLFITLRLFSGILWSHMK